MATLLARQGRHRQLYEDNCRLVSGCIPYRMKKRDEESGSSIEDRFEVLMVSSPGRHDFVFPKGGWENDETIHEAACREALEEAGVRGNINPTQLGVWEFRSKSTQAMNILEGGCRGYMFALEVTEELDAWPEQEKHTRKWMNIRDAYKFCRYEWMKDALRLFMERMDHDRQQRKTNNPMARDSSVTLSAAILPERPVAKTQVSHDRQQRKTNNPMTRDSSVTLSAAILPERPFSKTQVSHDRQQRKTNNHMARDSSVTLSAAILPERPVAKPTTINRQPLLLMHLPLQSYE